MTKREREACCTVIGFLKTVSGASNNVFAAGAEYMVELMEEVMNAGENAVLADADPQAADRRE